MQKPFVPQRVNLDRCSSLAYYMTRFRIPYNACEAFHIPYQKVPDTGPVQRKAEEQAPQILTQVGCLLESLASFCFKHLASLVLLISNMLDRVHFQIRGQI